jgi:hypothetical protein
LHVRDMGCMKINSIKSSIDLYAYKVNIT